MGDELEDVSLSQYDERTRRGLERIKPRNLAANPRCLTAGTDRSLPVDQAR